MAITKSADLEPGSVESPGVEKGPSASSRGSTFIVDLLKPAQKSSVS